MAIFQPFQALVAMTGSGLGGIQDKYVSLRDSREENKKIREEMARLQNEKIKIENDLKAAEAIIKVTNWKSEIGAETVPARVIARDSTTWYRTVTIDKGAFSGIEKDQPVVTEDGLVGRVILVAPTSARVLLMTDERHATGATVGQASESRILGIVQGTSNSYGKNNFRCELKLVGGTGEKPQIGELIITSGQDGFYPKGIAVGRVVEPLSAAENSPDLVPLQPLAALNKLDVVGVVLVSKEKIRAQVEDLNRIEREKEKEDLEKEKLRKLTEQQKKKQAEQPPKQ